MSRSHIVRRGEHLSAIAAQYGFGHDDSVWLHPENEALRATRPSPHVLAPGDAVAIPDAERKHVDAASDRSHRYVIRRSELQLAVRLLDWQARPIAGAECQLAVNGKIQRLTSDGEGVIRATVPRGARRAKLTHEGTQYDLAIGHLDPVDQRGGLESRLQALGYLVGDPEDVDADLLRFAIELFQRDHGLAVDGERTETLAAKVVEVHGS